MNILRKEKSGFTLPEVMISIMIIAMTTLATVEVLMYLFKYVVMNNNQVIATNLAREGIELVRNQRDSNWLIWSGSLRESWNNGFDGVTNVNGNLYGTSAIDPTFTIPTEDVGLTSRKLYFLAQREPYILELWKVDPTETIEQLLDDTTGLQHLSYDTSSGYVHTDGENSAFYRFIEISYSTVDDSGNYDPSSPDNLNEVYDANTVKVISVVGYKHNNRWKTVQLETYLSDWYQRTSHDDNPN